MREAFESNGRKGWVENGQLHVTEERASFDAEHDSYVLQPYGWLTEIGVVFSEPVPNMNASNRWRVRIEIFDHEGIMQVPLYAVVGRVVDADAHHPVADVSGNG